MASFKVVIPSRARADQVTAHIPFEGLVPITLCVPLAEVAAYAASLPHAKIIPQRRPGISGARNDILDAFKDSDVLMLDDDVSAIGRFVTRAGKNYSEPKTGQALVDLIESLFATAAKAGALYWGCAPTSNPIFYSPSHPISRNSFVNGSFSGYAAGCPLRFDETLRLKEDYDLSVQAYLSGGLLRFNFVYAKAKHRENEGGAVDYRSPALEKEAIAILRGKWGTVICDHPRRPFEIVLRLPKM